MVRSKMLACALVVALLGTGCASLGVQPTGNRSTCALVGGLLGGFVGYVIANNRKPSETDEELVGGGLGAATGAAIGYLICGEGEAPIPPSARIRATPREGQPPLEVSFEAQVAPGTSPIRKYAWDFGDGATGEGQRTSHTYANPGEYEARLTVTDERNQSATSNARILVRTAEQPARQEEPATRRRIVLRGINFAFDSAVIAAADEAILDVAVEQLQSNPDVRVRITGHTDSTGPDGYNQNLSERRARSVLDYLVRKGIARGRLEAAGQGESQPVASNDTRDGRAQNRRVELDILE
jgi:OmpA-OmpF porin, OOP family